MWWDEARPSRCSLDGLTLNEFEALVTGPQQGRNSHDRGPINGVQVKWTSYRRPVSRTCRPAIKVLTWLPGVEWHEDITAGPERSCQAAKIDEPYDVISWM